MHQSEVDNDGMKSDRDRTEEKEKKRIHYDKYIYLFFTTSWYMQNLYRNV